MSSYTDARPLSTFPRKEREILEQFQTTENGTDCTFKSLPNRARELANEFMSRAENVNELVQMLDSSIEFREAVRETDLNTLPKATDSVIRYYNFKINSGYTE